MTAECSRATSYLKAELKEEPAAVDLLLSGGASPVLVPFVEGLQVSYVVDQGDHYEYITHGALAASGYDESWLRQRGLDGLWEAIEGTLTVQPHGGIFVVLAGGNMEASVLLLHDLWERAFRSFVEEGPYLAVVPARDILAFGPDSEGVRAELEGVVERTWDGGDHLISRRVYRWADGAWGVA